MVNNIIALIGIGLYLLGLYQSAYFTAGESKIGIIFCMVGVGFMMFEFLKQKSENHEAE